jgi:hypothetical protein
MKDDKAQLKTLNRIHDDRFIEHLDKALMPLEKGEFKHDLRTKYTEWERVLLNSNCKIA